MTLLLVTGTSTGVGKTVVTAALAAVAVAAGRSVAVCKPAQTGVAVGEAGDLEDIRRLSGVEDLTELARYPDPLAPDTAARRSGLPPLNLAQVVAAVRELDARSGVTLVEGAGGLLVGLGAGGFTLLDVARELSAPVVIVAAAGLGTLNHSALTVHALAAAGVECAGLIVGSWPQRPDLASECNVEDLPRVTGVDVVGSVPEGAGGLDHLTFVASAVEWFDKSWVAQHF
ncbi:dethiobiotin synthase [Antrihabitans sp. YC2-6]|uniref:dethiobiotin synthase n=1 Tax=Antrihabitans sp. YC2-6 TaxID=2799498 RepID=UPI0018F29565|nr:dethiobiotin synthase [Antrihabitans sp. YC2-6]MBJ8343172.1 ATP-dependent dethiobiotin synthetase BioD [Antrihabitans sp. YC2-6]